MNTIAVNDGGPAEVALQFARSWEQDIRLQLTALVWKSPTAYDLERAAGVRLLSLDGRRRPLRCVRVAIRLVRDADIIYLHGFYLPASFLFGLLAHLSGKPYLLQAHGVFEPYQVHQSKRKKLLADHVFGRRLASRAVGIIFATERESNQAILPGSTRHHVMPLGGAGSHPPRSTFGSRVLFLGRIAKKKRVDLVLAAWPKVLAHVPGAQLVIAGEDDGTVARALRSFPPNIASSITVTGQVGGRKRDDLYANSDVFVLPSENENFAVAVAEAAGWGLVPVLSRYVAVAEYLGPCGVKYVEVLTADALSSALVEILSDPTELQRISRVAQGRAQQELSWSAAAGRVATLISDLMEDGSDAPSACC